MTDNVGYVQYCCGAQHPGPTRTARGMCVYLSVLCHRPRGDSAAWYKCRNGLLVFNVNINNIVSRIDLHLFHM